MDTKTALVEQVKIIQRQGLQAKQAWWDYCDTNLSGTRDPNRHDEAVLMDFIQTYEATGGAGAGAMVAAPAKGQGKGCGGGCWGGGGGCDGVSSLAAAAAAAAAAVFGKGAAKGAGGWSESACGGGGAGWGAPAFGKGAAGGMSQLADFIKTGQRVSPSWKAAWQKYCAIHGGGLNDPSKHTDQYILDFIGYASDLASSTLESEALAQGFTLDQGGKGGAPKRSYGGSYGGSDAGCGKGGYGGYGGYGGCGGMAPPAKRVCLGGSVAAVPVDGEHAELVNKVKSFQRTGPDAKQAWWTFCDERGGTKDPARHDAETLQEFIALSGMM